MQSLLVEKSLTDHVTIDAVGVNALVHECEDDRGSNGFDHSQFEFERLLIH